MDASGAKLASMEADVEAICKKWHDRTDMMMMMMMMMLMMMLMMMMMMTMTMMMMIMMMLMIMMTIFCFCVSHVSTVLFSELFCLIAEGGGRNTRGVGNIRRN